jgi:hypothetical protein
MRRLRAVAAAMSAGLAALVAAGYAMFGIVYVQHYVPPPNRPIFRQLQLQLAGGRVTGQYDSNTSGSVFPMAIGWHFGQLSRSTTPSWRARSARAFGRSSGTATATPVRGSRNGRSRCRFGRWRPPVG